MSAPTSRPTDQPTDSGDPADRGTAPAAPAASRAADRALAAQRAEATPSPGAAAPNVDEEGVAALVSNTGLDGDAASG